MADSREDRVVPSLPKNPIAMRSDGVVGRTAQRADPPRDLDELLSRAQDLAGLSLAEVAAAVGVQLTGEGLRTKGKAGDVIERALGASAGSAKGPDFAQLGVELKTIPVDSAGRPRESTFVCALGLSGADREEWNDSWVRKKLARVLWVPILVPAEEPSRRTIERARLWSPTSQQESVLADDFDKIMGLVGSGRIEELDARLGRFLQARPKAAHGQVRTLALDADGAPILTLPRGFYLRARFTGAVLRDPTAMPD